MNEHSQRRAAFIFLLIALIGLIVCLMPALGDISIENGAPAYVALGGLLVLTGLIGAPIFFRRARVLAGMMAPEKFLAHWIEGAGTAEQLEAVITTDGMIFGKEFYTFSGFSCRLEGVALESAAGAERLRFTISTPRKTGRHKHNRDIAVPPAERATAQRIVEVLQARYHS